MKKSRFSESQIISILKEGDSGMKIEELCRKHGIPLWQDSCHYLKINQLGVFRS